MNSVASEVVEVRELSAALRHGWRRILAMGVLVGLAALGFSFLTPPRYRGEATLLLRAESQSPFSLGSVLPIPMGGALGALGGADALETELGILNSRSVIGSVVDSLRLQAVVREPRGVPARALFGEARPEGRPERRVIFTREGDRYRAEGEGVEGYATPGVPFPVGAGSVTLATGRLPSRIEVELLSRDAAIDAVTDDLGVSVKSGELAAIRYAAPDPVTAAAVANSLVDHYLQRRRTVDRGVNQHRYEFLETHIDSISTALAVAEQQLRRDQETYGVLDPALSGETGLEEAMRLQGAYSDLEVEATALGRVLNTGRLPARELAAYPTLLQNPAINSILDRLLDLEADRAKLLETRTPGEPQVASLTTQIEQLEAELARLSRAYMSGLQRQQEQLGAELQRYQSALSTLPSEALQIYRREREVKRLSETLIVLQAQLVQTRLAAIGEGGEARAIDVASIPERPYFPMPFLFTIGGVLGGLFFGVALTFTSSLLGRRVRLPWEAARLAGAPVAVLEADAPLLLGGLDRSATLLVAPIGGAPTDRPGARIAQTAALNGKRVVLVDLSHANGGALPAPRPGVEPAPFLLGDGDGSTSVVLPPASEIEGYAAYRVDPTVATPLRTRVAVDELEKRYDLVVALVPPLTNPYTVALMAESRSVVLVAQLDEARRDELESTADGFRRMGLHLAGVVVTRLAPKGNGRAA